MLSICSRLIESAVYNRHYTSNTLCCAVCGASCFSVCGAPCPVLRVWVGVL